MWNGRLGEGGFVDIVIDGFGRRTDELTGREPETRVRWMILMGWDARGWGVLPTWMELLP
jgi:hypothetical protein